MDWLFSIVRVAGASFPVASSLVQLQAEIDSKKLTERIAKLEDPVSYLHKDVPDLSKNIYRKLKEANSTELKFESDFYKKYSRALAALVSQNYIKGKHTIGKNYAEGLSLSDPSYIMYLCALEENDAKMESLIRIVDECKVGEWIDGKKIQISLELPLPVIKAVFDIYESKGYGLCSKTLGEYKYMGKA